MILILGGVHSGRRAFLESLHLSPESVYELKAEDARAFAEECGKKALEAPLSLTCSRIASFDAVIATEMGLGIIPLEHENRRLREENGRLNIALASLADCVVLMTAGIPTVIKGSLNCLQKKSRYLLVFRHGATEANVEKRYAGGASDLDLCGAGREQLERTKEYLQTFAENCSPAIREKILFPKKIYLSPMKRALQTAQILYPQAEQCLVEDFREMDFGLFENHTADELFSDEKTRAAYQAFVDSGAKMKCPPSDKSPGESMDDFLRRTADAFEKLAQESSEEVMIVIAHGGTQMSLFSQFSPYPLEEQSGDVSSYYGWQTDCASFRFGIISVTKSR